MEIRMDKPDSAAIQVRVDGPIFVLIENWRRSQSKIPSRSEALRQLVELGLQAEPPGIPAS
jgi:hypothetical protein